MYIIVEMLNFVVYFYEFKPKPKQETKQLASYTLHVQVHHTPYNFEVDLHNLHEPQAETVQIHHIPYNLVVDLHNIKIML